MTRKQHAKFHHIAANEYGLYAIDDDGDVWEFIEEGDEDREEGWWRLSGERHDD